MDKSDYYHALHEGEKIDWFEIRSVLGAGGFGITYLAWDERLQCQVAIKEYLPSDMAVRKTDGTSIIARSSADKENFQYGLKSFLEEARTLARFNEPNIIRVRTFLEANCTAYMVMDYEEGEPLDALLKREGTLDESEIMSIIIPILDGLRVVHQAEFLHRDIKPGNIYLRKDGPPVLIDFGAARQALGEHSRSMTGIVTQGYAPFEQYSTRGKQGPWTDLYAIGSTLYRCITGHAPLEASERIAAIGEDEPDPLIPAMEIGKGRYSQPLLQAIDWMLKPAAKDRPQTVTEVLDLLLGRSATPKQQQPVSSAVAGQHAQAAPVSTLQRSGKLKWAGIAAALLGAIAVGAWWFNTMQFTDPFASQQSSVELQGKQVVSKFASSAEPPPVLTGHLQVSVNVNAARILLDGVDLGTAGKGSPLNHSGIFPGVHQLRVVSPGYLTYEQRINIKRDSWEQIALQLLAEPKPWPFEPMMVAIPGGSFSMGDLSEDEYDDEKPVRQLLVIPFLMAETETTFAQWDACVDAGGCRHKPDDEGWGRGDRPVINISWVDIGEYIYWLNYITGKGYGLPSETEWEYAARAGSTTKYSWGDDIDCAQARYGHFSGDCGNEMSSTQVKSFQPNAFGLYDMHGNVWEWTEDCWNASYSDAPDDGALWINGACESSVRRGGSWDNGYYGLRSAIRGKDKTTARNSRVGFRLARDSGHWQ